MLTAAADSNGYVSAFEDGHDGQESYGYGA